MLCTGVDIIEISRIEVVFNRWGKRFLHRVYTGPERELCCENPQALAVRFAGKEAVMKALGTGTRGVSWKEIEIIAMPTGQPLVHLYGQAQKISDELGLAGLAISLSHSKEYAVAFVVGEIKK